MKRIKAVEMFKALESRLDAGKRARAKKLIEDLGDEAGDVMVPDEPADEEGDYKADLLAAVAKLLDSDDEESQGLVTKIMGLLKPAKKAEPAAESEGDGDKKNDEDKDKKKDDVKESRLAQLERKDACRDLCESMGFTPTPPQLEALTAVAGDKPRKTIAETFQAAQKSNSTRSRSGHFQEGRSGDAPAVANHENFASRLLN